MVPMATRQVYDVQAREKFFHAESARMMWESCAVIANVVVVVLTGAAVERRSEALTSITQTKASTYAAIRLLVERWETEVVVLAVAVAVAVVVAVIVAVAVVAVVVVFVGSLVDADHDGGEQ